MKHLSVFLLLLISSFTYSQKSKNENKGDKFYMQYSFSDAIDSYLKSQKLTDEGMKRLAESYFNTGQYSKSESAYAKVMETNSHTPDDIFSYAAVLRFNGHYEESVKWMEKLAETAPEDIRAKLFIRNRDKLPELFKDQGQYKITNQAINTEHQEFGPAFYGNKIVFASSKEEGKAIRRSYNWNSKPFLDLYESDVKNNELLEPERFHKKVNKKLHEGPATFSADGNKMIYTTNNYSSKSKDQTRKLQLFISEKNEKGKWKEGVPFSLNNSEYSVGHATISNDGKIMFFSSDMPGGIGGADIYRIEKDENGTWGKPVNLGTEINTEGNEMFPYYEEENGILFFASNGHPGLGGLDIFLTKEIKDQSFGKVLNAGSPLNTRFDDFAFIIDNRMSKGYFSSNREGGKGDDDIYGFELLSPFKLGKTITLVFKDNQGNLLTETLAGISYKSGKTDTLKSNEKGEISISLEEDQILEMNAGRKEYLEASKVINTDTINDNQVIEIILKKDPGTSLVGIVKDAGNKKALNEVTVTVKDRNNGNIVYQHTTEPTGEFLKPLDGKKAGDKISYTITLEKKGYLKKELQFDHIITKPGKISIDETLDLSLSKIEVGGDLAKMIDIKPIYFDLGKHTIRKDAAAELDKIVKIMNENSDMVIELGSHTDCRGNYLSNEKLSDNRAKASAEYIKKKISNPDRIFGKGYGESKLKNDCACEGITKSNCSEAQHQENRRTEFIIIKVSK